MEFSEIVRQRRSIKRYDADRPISNSELAALFEQVILSPSSFNLQHWIFIAVRDGERKRKLKEAAWGQPQVSDCSAAILVCGKLDAHRDAPAIYQDAPKPVQDQMLPMIAEFYDGKDRLMRDEAIRSASLAAMTLMYAAKDRGFDTGPMIGFDPERAATLLELTPEVIPVMLIVLGYAAAEPRPRDARRPIEEVVRLETLGGAGLKRE